MMLPAPPKAIPPKAIPPKAIPQGTIVIPTADEVMYAASRGIAGIFIIGAGIAGCVVGLVVGAIAGHPGKGALIGGLAVPLLLKASRF